MPGASTVGAIVTAVLVVALLAALLISNAVVNKPTLNGEPAPMIFDSNVNDPMLATARKSSRLPPVPISTIPIDSNTLIIGAGVGGLVSGYRLAPILKDKLVIVDERDHVGGKVQSVRKASSNSTHPIWGPTHAEQLRGGDSICRCLAQEVGASMVKRLTRGGKVELAVYGTNTSAFQCYGPMSDGIPNASATCAAGSPYDMYAPNGIGFDPNVYPNLPAGICGQKDWTECSYITELVKLVISSAGKIKNGESAKQFLIRVFGVGTEKFMKDNLEYMDNWDAHAMIEYYAFDYAFPYGAFTLPHGGPQVSIWNQMARYIQKNGSRIYLNTRIISIDYATGADATAGYLYVATSADGRRFRTTRLILAFPTSHLDMMSGTVVDDLKASQFIQYNGGHSYCSYNVFYETKWWEAGKVCHAGVCATRNFNISGWGDEGFMFHQIISIDDTNGLWGQYTPTPDRREGNLYRFFGDGDDTCGLFNSIYASGGILAIQQEFERRLGVLYANAVPAVVVGPVVQQYYTYEPDVSAVIRPGAPYTIAQQVAWASNPLPRERIVFATENLNHFHSGWMEGAAISAHNALTGPVFKDTISATHVRSLERCRANITNGANRYLDNSNKNSGNDLCLLMRNEYTIRELAGLNPCGGPTEFEWPPLSSFTGTPFDPNQNMWSGATSTPIYEADYGFGRKRASLL